MKIISIIVSSSLLFAAPAVADGSYTTRAKVLDSRPIIETAYEEVEVCRYRYENSSRGSRRKSKDDTGERIIGGVLGGAAGSAIGKGRGRDASAAAGAVLGSTLGGDGELTGGGLIGGVAGGIIGNQIGKGSGKTAATAAGALIGSIVGENIERGGAVQDTRTSARRKVRVCDIEERPKKVITGYDVTFEHGGREFTTVVSQRPEEFLDISVDIQVLESHTSVRY
jgi:uncharacterized protein YcfJ